MAHCTKRVRAASYSAAGIDVSYSKHLGELAQNPLDMTTPSGFGHLVRVYANRHMKLLAKTIESPVISDAAEAGHLDGSTLLRGFLLCGLGCCTHKLRCYQPGNKLPLSPRALWGYLEGVCVCGKHSTGEVS